MTKRSLITKISKKVDRVIHGGNIGYFFTEIEDLLMVYLRENYEKGVPKKL